MEPQKDSCPGQTEEESSSTEDRPRGDRGIFCPVQPGHADWKNYGNSKRGEQARILDGAFKFRIHISDFLIIICAENTLLYSFTSWHLFWEGVFAFFPMNSAIFYDPLVSFDAIAYHNAENQENSLKSHCTTLIPLPFLRKTYLTPSLCKFSIPPPESPSFPSQA